MGRGKRVSMLNLRLYKTFEMLVDISVNIEFCYLRFNMLSCVTAYLGPDANGKSLSVSDLCPSELLRIAELVECLQAVPSECAENCALSLVETTRQWKGEFTGHYIPLTLFRIFLKISVLPYFSCFFSVASSLSFSVLSLILNRFPDKKI